MHYYQQSNKYVNQLENNKNNNYYYIDTKNWILVNENKGDYVNANK